MSTEDEAVTRGKGGSYFAIIEPTSSRGASTEVFTQMKELVKWVIDDLDYYLSNATVNEVKDIVDTAGVAVVDLPVASLTIFKSGYDPKKED